MKKMAVSGTCPFFPGFYNTIFDASELAYEEGLQMAEDYNAEYKTDRFTGDMFDLDYGEYQDGVALAYVEAFKSQAPSFVEDVRLVEIDSPKYYNFRNDELVISIDLKDGWDEEVKSFMSENHDWLADRIKKDWTSYDGFMSFMSNDISEWDKFLFEECDTRYITTMIGYMMYHENENIREDLEMETYENVSAYSYMYVTDDGEFLKSDLYDEAHQPGWDMTNQLDIQFS